MARIDFITLETYGSGAPVDLELVTYRYARREDSERERLQASDTLGHVSMNYQLPMHKSYRYQRGISIGLVERSSSRALDGWKWVDELPTERNGRPSRAYLEFRDGSRLFKLLYRVILGSHNEEARQSEDYDEPEPNDVPRCVPRESDSPHLTCDDGLVIEYPQPRDVGLQALLYNFGIDDAELRPAHRQYLQDRVLDRLRSGYTLRAYGLADRSFRNRALSRDERREHNHMLSGQRARAVVNYLQDTLAGEARFQGDEVTYEGEVPAERARPGRPEGDEEFEENPLFRGAYLEVVAPVVPQTGLIVTAIDSSVEGGGQKIEGVRVTIAEHPVVAIAAENMTTSNGNATFLELAPGLYRAYGNKAGYDTASEEAEVRTGEITQLELSMSRRQEDGSIVVDADRWVRIRFDINYIMSSADLEVEALGVGVPLLCVKINGTLLMTIEDSAEVHEWKFFGGLETIDTMGRRVTVSAHPTIVVFWERIREFLEGFDMVRFRGTTTLLWNANRAPVWNRWREADAVQSLVAELSSSTENLRLSVRNVVPSSADIRDLFRKPNGSQDGSLPDGNVPEIDRSPKEILEEALPLVFEPLHKDSWVELPGFTEDLGFRNLKSFSPLPLRYGGTRRRGSLD